MKSQKLLLGKTGCFGGSKGIKRRTKLGYHDNDSYKDTFTKNESFIWRGRPILGKMKD
jgi:hypothetical protein